MAKEALECLLYMTYGNEYLMKVLLNGTNAIIMSLQTETKLGKNA